MIPDVTSLLILLLTIFPRRSWARTFAGRLKKLSSKTVDARGIVGVIAGRVAGAVETRCSGVVVSGRGPMLIPVIGFSPK